MLMSIAGVLSSEELTYFRAQLAAADWQDGTRTAGTLARSVKRNLQLADGSALAVELGNHILRRLGNHPSFISAALPEKIYPPKFNCYRDGGTYGAHIDSAVMQVPGTAITVRSDLSATLFLNDPDTYDGGELEIEGPFGVQTAKLAAGDLLLYPSTSLHRVTPVTRGERLAAFFWIQSLVRNEGQRTVLYDLDQSIQSLTPELAPDDSRLLQLTGCYHNLLRMWATP